MTATATEIETEEKSAGPEIAAGIEIVEIDEAVIAGIETVAVTEIVIAAVGIVTVVIETAAVTEIVAAVIEIEIGIGTTKSGKTLLNALVTTPMTKDDQRSTATTIEEETNVRTLVASQTDLTSIRTVAGHADRPTSIKYPEETATTLKIRVTMTGGKKILGKISASEKNEISMTTEPQNTNEKPMVALHEEVMALIDDLAMIKTMIAGSTMIRDDQEEMTVGEEDDPATGVDALDLVHIIDGGEVDQDLGDDPLGISVNPHREAIMCPCHRIKQTTLPPR